MLLVIAAVIVVAGLSFDKISGCLIRLSAKNSKKSLRGIGRLIAIHGRKSLQLTEQPGASMPLSSVHTARSILSFATTTLYSFKLGDRDDPTIKETAEAARQGRRILASLAERSPTAQQCLKSLKVDTPDLWPPLHELTCKQELVTLSENDNTPSSESTIMGTSSYHGPRQTPRVLHSNRGLQTILPWRSLRGKMTRKDPKAPVSGYGISLTSTMHAYSVTETLDRTCIHAEDGTSAAHTSSLTPQSLCLYQQRGSRLGKLA